MTDQFDEFESILSKDYLSDIDVVSKKQPTHEEPTKAMIEDPIEEVTIPVSDEVTIPVSDEAIVPITEVKQNITSGASYRGSGGDGSEYLPKGSGEGGVFAYVRRSAEDRTNRPLDVQIRTINEYVEENHRKLGFFTKNNAKVRYYFGDNGVSGSTDVSLRPGLTSLFKELDDLITQPRAPALHVVIYDATRLARTVAVGSSIKEDFGKRGVTLHLAQQRMVVEGSMEEMFFGLGLQMAASERNATITRVKQAFKHKENWDPRKSYGWKFLGKGVQPEPVPEEQELLKKIKEMYESGKLIKDITKFMKEQGKRRCRKIGEEDKFVEWNGTDIGFIIRKNKFKWPGTTFLDLRVLVQKFVESKDTEQPDNMLDLFLKENKDLVVEGTTVNRVMLRKILVDEKKGLEARAHKLLKIWIKQGRSNDDIVNMLNSQLRREDGTNWPRQTVWRRIKEVENEIEFERKQNSN